MDIVTEPVKNRKYYLDKFYQCNDAAHEYLKQGNHNLYFLMRRAATVALKRYHEEMRKEYAHNN